MTGSLVRRGASAALIAFLIPLFASPAAAQYFGQNHVQYQTFDFQVLKTAHFDIHFYPEEREAANLAGRMAERWYARLSRILQDSLHGRQPLIVYAAAAQFRQTNAVGGEIGEGTGGVTESFKRRIVVPFGVSLNESDHVIGHELVHAFQYDMASRSPGGMQGMGGLPLWFIEGMAEYLSLGPLDPQTAMWMRDALQRNDMPKVKDLDRPKYFPYRYGQAFWAYVGGRYGDEMIASLLRAGTRTRDPLLAIRSVLSVDPDTLSAQWHDALRSAFNVPADSSARILVATGGAASATALFTRQTSGGELNVGPALSPDGSRIVFLSERSRFSIDLYLADAASGRIIRKVTETAVDPHLESLQFIYSAGAWNPDGRRFAVAAQAAGRAVLRIYDLQEGGTDREIPLRSLDEIFNPTWSPDGQKVVFTAQVGGLTDLYLYDMPSGDLRRLTHDAWANLEPAWSPDGNRIAFVTDQFGSELATMDYGRYRLALLDLASGRVTPVAAFAAGKQINPQWSADGRSLFFLADPDGITNVYRLELAGGAMYRLTDLVTGASGITALSPALSVAGNRMAVSVYRDGGAEIYRFDEAAMQGLPATDAGGFERAALLPPRERGENRVSQYLADARTGLVAADSFKIEPYRGGFGLDYVAQANVAVGSDRFGTFVGGGAALFWSSMLGDRQLGTMLQINGSLKDIAAGVSYTNLRRRLDWGVQVSQIPYVVGGYSRTLEDQGGLPVVVDREIIQRQINRQVGVSLQYPFNRAQRLEFGIGGRQISFNGEQREVVFDPLTGTVISDSRTDLDIGSSLMLGEATTALVFDNSLFGGTGPVLGQRWRIEASPTVGSLTFVSALADFRKYFMLARPVSFAARVMHYGRYGSSGDDPRLSPLYLGYMSLVRGYDNGSFQSSECVPTTTDACPAFNQLLGSKVLVGNAELRIALMGPLGLAARGFLPIDLAFFADGGVAWSRGQSPAVFGGNRPLVSSVGAGLRLNLFGFAIGEVDVVRPLDRPGKGWYLQFGINPGF